MFRSELQTPMKWTPENPTMFHNGTPIPSDAVFPVAPPASIGRVISAYTPYYDGRGPLSAQGRLAASLVCGVVGCLVGVAYEFFSGPLAKASFFWPMALGFAGGVIFGFVFSCWEARISFIGTDGFADIELDPRTFGIKTDRIVQFKNYRSITTTSYRSDKQQQLFLDLVGEDQGGAKVTLLTEVVDDVGRERPPVNAAPARWISPDDIRPSLYASISAAATAFYMRLNSLENGASKGPGADIVVCPCCRTRVAKMRNGLCPACKKALPG